MSEDKTTENIIDSDEKENDKKKITHVTDIVLWSLWIVLMWGFLIILIIVDSPSNQPGIHEFIITAYFLGFSVVFAIIYIIYLKRG